MDKEQEILKKLEQLRVEQLKALRELKKVEKAKKKQRRRTTHGYPRLAKSGSSERNIITDVTTPAQCEDGFMGTTSKSCSRIGGPRIKTPNTLSMQGVAHGKRVDVQISKPHMSEPVRKNKNASFDANELVSKPVLSLDVTPKTSLLSPHVAELRNPGRLTKSLKISRKCRSPLTFPVPTNSRKMSVSEKQGYIGNIRKMKSVSGTSLEKDSEPRKTFSRTEDGENETNPHLQNNHERDNRGRQKSSMPEFTSSNDDEKKELLFVSKNQRPCRKIMKVESVSGNALEKDSEPQIFAGTEDANPRNYDGKVNNGKEKPSMLEFTSSKGNQKTKIFSSCSAVSPYNKRSDEFSQNIFSQSYFEDNLVKEQRAAEEKANENDLTGRCGNLPNTSNRNIGKWLSCKKMTVKGKTESVETNNSVFLQHENSAVAHKSCISVDTLQDGVVQKRSGDNLLSQGEIGKNTPMVASNGDEMPRGSERNMSANCFSLINCEAQNGHVSTIVNTVVSDMSNGASGMPAALSSEVLPNIKQNETVNNETREDNETLKRQKNTTPLVMKGNIAEGHKKISEHEDACLHPEQQMKLQPETIEDILKDFPQIAKMLANELKVNDTNSMLKREYENVNNEAKRENNITKQDVENLQSSRDTAKECLSDDLTSIPHQQNEINEIHSFNPNVPGICLQHSLSSSEGSNEVRAIKFLKHQFGETRLDMIAVCLPRLLVLWRAVDQCKWIAMHRWLLGEDEEIISLEVVSVGSCIALIIGGNLHKALGRVYVVHDKGDCKFDIFEEISFSDLGEIAYAYKGMCLLPNKESTENVGIIMAGAFGGKIVLTKWTIDLICFCLEDCKDLPDIFGDEISSLCLVQGSKCLLLGIVHSDVYLWNYKSCELLHRMTLQLTIPVCLSAETEMGLIFLSLLHKEENKVHLVAINPQTSLEAHLKVMSIAHVEDNKTNKLLFCSKNGAYVMSSFQHGRISFWHIATNEKIVLDQKIGEIYYISLHPDDSVIAFGTTGGCVYLNVL
ncbi:uncharacterized protein LOC114523365 isoform X2 [Dendronephthya gigantea]|uniref:uncharacterized protein LOC114523365 isoform X2 n=1 Tax=Dendronephthya gigantea TaxID=151771 RepID=UPI00106D906D|nr:uncharacterized protein LOC114523365 isoform X2 [Dendronephthya gigantea]